MADAVDITLDTDDLVVEEGIGKVVDTTVDRELSDSFMEYALSVIHSRALPDVRDGLQPVHRRILYTMWDMNLQPDRGYVKMNRVSGQVLGKLHPHGSTAIEDAMFRMGQDFSLRVPLVDGHGNYGSLDDPPAAARYVEARMSPAAVAMCSDLDEGTVDWRPNYDDRETEPVVLPAAFPALVVNGAAGIAVGMATNMAPHNLGEVCDATRWLLRRRRAGKTTTPELMARKLAGPDFPGGCVIVDDGGASEAYIIGRGTVRMRAAIAVEQVARRTRLIVTALPYKVGPEKVTGEIRDLVRDKQVTSVRDVIDLSDRTQGLRLVIELKSGFAPADVIADLCKLTSLEKTFPINATALVDGVPRSCTLLDLISCWLDHRVEVIERRCRHRLGKATDRAHLVDGLIQALDEIDEIVSMLRAAKTTSDARKNLTGRGYSRIQADYILEMPLRRLVGLEREKLAKESAELAEIIAELEAILADPDRLAGVVDSELAATAKQLGEPRQSPIVDGAGDVRAAAGQMAEIAASAGVTGPPVVLSGTVPVTVTVNGLIAAGPAPDGDAVVEDLLAGECTAAVEETVAFVTVDGRAVRMPVTGLPAVSAGSRGGDGAEVTGAGAPVVGVVGPVTDDTLVVGMVSKSGRVKRLSAGELERARDDSFEIFGLDDGDQVVCAAPCADDAEFVIVTASGQVLRFAADAVRPQGRPAAGMTGIRLAGDDHVVAAGIVPAGQGAVAVRVNSGAWKVTPVAEFPAKGRGTGGVRIGRFRKTETHLDMAAVVVDAGRVGAAHDGGGLYDPASLPVRDRDASADDTADAVIRLGLHR